ncbi:MAG: catechol 2,3-dioxygenase-like lactoylglutathione lyase family enzyme [Arenicella sp.]|jgi:catechol 2,3-dioxygenase-like lactoylglutathione lyase family enzyme
MKIIRVFSALVISCISWQLSAIEIDKSASIKDTTTTMLGVNHIALSVKDLDKTLAFYQQASGYELLSREQVSGDENADALFGKTGIVYEVAVLKAPNMLFELTEFKHNQNATIQTMPPQGPGMTHTCFQSPASKSGWDKFVAAGATALSRGGKPIDLGGYGVTYGYAYDPEGNMVELEQLDDDLLAKSSSAEWAQKHKLWMTQVALATHDIEALMGFYQQVLGFMPNRVAPLKDKIRADEIVDIENVHMLGGWFKMSEYSKTLEFWQFVNPVTPKPSGQRDVTALGYSFSLEVGDIQQEYRRLSELGLKFVSKPIKLGEFWRVYTHDIDGNVFSLRQVVNSESALSVQKLDRR